MWPTAFKGFPRGTVVKNAPAKAGDARDASSIPESGRFSGNGNPFQDSCLENSMDRGAWWAIVHGITEEWDMTDWHSNTMLWSVCGLCSVLTDHNSGNIHPLSCSPVSQHQEPWWSVLYVNLSGLPYSVIESNCTLFWCCWGGIK